MVEKRVYMVDDEWKEKAGSNSFYPRLHTALYTGLRGSSSRFIHRFFHHKGGKKRKKEVCRCFLKENLWWVFYIFHKFAA